MITDGLLVSEAEKEVILDIAEGLMLQTGERCIAVEIEYLTEEGEA